MCNFEMVKSIIIFKCDYKLEDILQKTYFHNTDIATICTWVYTD